MGTSESKTEPSISTPPTEILPVKTDSTLNYLLMGKVANGKSSSGNALVGENVFQSSNSATAGTKYNWRYRTKRLGKDLCVVDTPGLHDTEHMNSNIEGARFARKYMTKAFQLCPQGFDALLIVFNVTNRYSSEDKRVIDLLKEIFGEDMFEYTILIFTHGDNFDSEHHLLDADKSQKFFKRWCRKRDGDLGTLLKKCQYRAVLFHNTDTYELHRDVELIALEGEMKKISSKWGRYTGRIFQMNERRRKHFLLNNYLPDLQKEINEKLVSLKKEYLLIQSDGKTITDKTKDVLEAIVEHELKYPTLLALKDSVENLHNNFTLQTTNQEKFHLVTKTQELIDGKILSELRSLSNFIDYIRNPEKHKEELKNKAKALARYTEEEDLGTNKLDDLKKKVEMFLLQIDDLDTMGSGSLTEMK